LSFGVPVVPRSYTYQDFAAKMKLPGAQDLVRTLKSYVKTVQSPDWLARHTQPAAAAGGDAGAGPGPSEFDRVRQEYNDIISGILRVIRHKHPLWKGSSEEEIDNTLESVEKFLTSKLYDRLFWNLFPADRARDRALADKLFVLHSWVAPRHLDLPVHCRADLSVWDHPAEELRNMDKFKSPRDKLVCLLNCCHIINSQHTTRTHTHDTQCARMQSGHLLQRTAVDRFVLLLFCSIVPSRHSEARQTEGQRREG
jgi:hypothetical protein